MFQRATIASAVVILSSIAQVHCTPTSVEPDAEETSEERPVTTDNTQTLIGSIPFLTHCSMRGTDIANVDTRHYRNPRNCSRRACLGSIPYSPTNSLCNAQNLPGCAAATRRSYSSFAPAATHRTA
eukprot:918062-Rhodomonas_salina.3